MKVSRFLTLALTLLPAMAAAIVVDTADDVVGDDDQCSLREAIENVNEGAAVHADCETGDTITFDASLAGATIVLNGEQLLLTQSVTIEGPVPGDPAGLTLDGDETSRILDISGEVTVTVQDVTFTRGRAAEGPTARRGGGGIKVHQGADVLLRRTRIVGNTTALTANHGGGVFVQNASLEVVDSEISNNKATVSVAHGGGIAVERGSLVLRRSLLAGNRSEFNDGGGLYLVGGEALIVNSTLSNNQARRGSAINAVESYQHPDPVRVQSSVTLVHSTVANNEAFDPSAATGQSIHVLGAGGQNLATWRVINSLLFLNDAGKRVCYVHAATRSWENSLTTHDSCGSTGVTPVADLRLGPLADNGGPTRTHSLGHGSVAIGAAGDCAADHDIDTDQRGRSRPGGETPTCDVGAYEMHEPPPEADLHLTLESDKEQASVGERVEFKLTAGNDGPDPALLSVVEVEIPDGFAIQSFETQHGTFDETTGLWTLGDLTPGQQVELVLVVEVTAVHDYVLSAGIAAVGFDPRHENNTRSVRVRLPPALIVVDTLEDVVADDGRCSLREALLNANGNDQSGSEDCAAGSDLDEITFDPSLAGGTVVLSEGGLMVYDDLVLYGPEEGRLDGIVLDGDEASRVILVRESLSVELRDLTLTRGHGSRGAGFDILAGGHARLRRVRVSDSVATHTNPAATVHGGGIYVSPNATLEMEDCEVTGNAVVSDKALGGGIAVESGTLVVVRSLIHGNRADVGGAGGLYAQNARVRLENTTFSNNIGTAEVQFAGGQAELAFVTIVSSEGPALEMNGTAQQPAAVDVVASLLVQQEPSGDLCAGLSEHAVLTVQSSLATDESCTAEVTTLEALKLSELCDNGGPTLTYALASDSVARAASAECPVDHDQRGWPRDTDGACDVGAFQMHDDDFAACAGPGEEPGDEPGEEPGDEPEPGDGEEESTNGGCSCQQGAADASSLLLLGLGAWLAPRRARRRAAI